jgi:heme-degrading monooxygenase HmoA
LTVRGRARFAPGQVVTVFRSRLRVADDPDYALAADGMERAARDAAGFVDFKSFVAEDGERVSLATFDSEATQRAWRDDLDHQEAQRRGRTEFYGSYSIQVGACTYANDWVRPES